MVILTEYDYGSMSKDELYQHAKEIAKKQGITKGLSKLTKRELADFIFHYSDQSTPVKATEKLVPVDTAEEPTPIEVIEEFAPVEFLKTEPLPPTPVTETESPETFAKKLVSHWKASQAESTNDSDRKRMWQECFDMCDSLQAHLLKTYAESTVIKTLTPKYRKAIATEANMLDPTVKGGYLYTAYPVAFWKVDQGSRVEIDSRTKVSLSEKKEKAIRIPVECREQLISKANDLLSIPGTSGQDIWRKALAISLLTGRRFYVEVCRNAQFYPLDEVVDFNRTLGFIGQAKGSVEKFEHPYQIPCYAENIELLIKNCEQIQSFTKSKDWYSDTISAKDFQSKIKSQCELALRVFNDICMPHGFAITIKDLRSMYMAFCVYDYRVLTGRHPNFSKYIGGIAGHDVTTNQGTYHSVSTTEHYETFIDARWDD